MVRDLPALAAREHDVLVVGGGISGAAVAWDAAQRGLAVALVERGDFGGETSWNSLKTIHGGLRHLQRADVAGLRESLRERRALLRIAPLAVRPLSFLVPAYGRGPRGLAGLALGVTVADLLGLDRNAGVPGERRLPRARVLSARAVLAELPDLPRTGLAGGVVWTDAQAETERLLMGFLHAAAGAGAGLANHAEVVGLARGRRGPWQARVLDRETGQESVLAARAVVNAAGPWVDALLGQARQLPAAGPLVRATNLVLTRPQPLRHVVGSRSSGRFLFLAPWRDRAIVGTDYETPEADPAAGARRFLEEARAAFPWAGLRREDVALVHRGLVPGTPRRLASRHRIVDHRRTGAPGLFSVVSVKYTTARGVAEQVVDGVGRWLERRLPRCRTAVTPLPGAGPLPGTLEEQALAAVREEMAAHLDDVVLRRLAAGAAGRPPAEGLARVSLAVSRELGWDPGREAAEAARLAAAYNAAELT